MAMTWRRIRFVGVGLVLVLLAGCGGSSADKAGGTGGRKPRILTMANAGGDAGEFAGFTREVARLSGGAMGIQVRNRWRAGQVKFETGLINDVKAGMADLGSVGSRAWDSVGVMDLRALHAPLLIDSYSFQERVVRSPLVGEMLRGLEPLGLVGLGVLPGPMRKPLGISKPLVVPADFAGVTIGVQQSLVADKTMRALGATSAWFPALGAINGLDGIEQQISSIDGNRYDKVGKHVTANVNLWPRPLVLFTSNKVLGSLSQDQQRILRQAVVNVTPAQTAYQRRDEQEATKRLCRRGLEFETASPDVLTALRRAVQPVYDALGRDPKTRRFLVAIAAIGKDIAVEPAPNCRAVEQGAGQAARGHTTLDGVYEMTTGRRAAAPEFFAENWGKWAFVFDRGQFAFTQENRDACTWGYGTFLVKGRLVEWMLTDGGGIAPTGAVNKPGESFVFGWSLYHETLTLTPVQGEISPENFRAKPWQRISTRPSIRHLSKRCPPPASSLPG